MAAGAGLPVLAALATGVYLIVAVVFPALTRFLPRSGTAISVARVRYPDGRGICARRCRPRPRAASRWTSCRSARCPVTGGPAWPQAPGGPWK
ncbi:MAG: hypothetical protein ACR2MP_19215 [Streptosporangiaceae bacterium]